MENTQGDAQGTRAPRKERTRSAQVLQSRAHETVHQGLCLAARTTHTHTHTHTHTTHTHTYTHTHKRGCVLLMVHMQGGAWRQGQVGGRGSRRAWRIRRRGPGIISIVAGARPRGPQQKRPQWPQLSHKHTHTHTHTHTHMGRLVETRRHPKRGERARKDRRQTQGSSGLARAVRIGKGSCG